MQLKIQSTVVARVQNFESISCLLNFHVRISTSVNNWCIHESLRGDGRVWNGGILQQVCGICCINQRRIANGCQRRPKPRSVVSTTGIVCTARNVWILVWQINVRVPKKMVRVSLLFVVCDLPKTILFTPIESHSNTVAPSWILKVDLLIVWNKRFVLNNQRHCV